MSAQTNEKLARSLYAAFNARRIDDALKLISDRTEWRNMATGETFRGHAGVRKFMEGWIHAFDDLKIDVKRVIATDTTIATESVVRGTHSGPLELHGGTIPATHKKVEVPICEVCQVDNGKLGPGGTYLDLASVMEQLGVTEPAAAHR